MKVSAYWKGEVAAACESIYKRAQLVPRATPCAAPTDKASPVPSCGNAAIPAASAFIVANAAPARSGLARLTRSYSASIALSVGRTKADAISAQDYDKC